MTLLLSPDGHTLNVDSTRTEELLLSRGWTPTDQPATPGARIVTAAEFEQLAATLETARAASQDDRADLRQMVEPMAQQLPEVVAEVDQLTATIEATTTQAAPKPTPRTDALEAWRAEAQAAIDLILAAMEDIDVPGAIAAWFTANPIPAPPTWATLAGKPTLATVATTGAYPDLSGKPTLGTAAAANTGTGATQVVLGNDARLSDARTPTAHTHAAGQVTGLATVATSGSYADLLSKPATFAPSAHTHPSSEVTGLHAVATSGDYTALSNKPTIPTVPAMRQVVVTAGALSANTAKAVPITWGSAMPSTNYAVVVSLDVTTATVQQYTLGVLAGSKTTTGCTIVLRSTAAVTAGNAPNIQVLALA